jgi:hypothetical protein
MSELLMEGEGAGEVTEDEVNDVVEAVEEEDAPDVAPLDELTCNGTTWKFIL